MGPIKSFEVQFTQTVKQDLFPEAEDAASGSLMFTRPQRMKWVYLKPKARRIEFDGKDLVIEEGDQKQIIHDRGRITLEKSFSFLWGQPDADIFRVESRGAKSFLVTPRHKDDVNFVSIEVEVNSGRVAQATIVDKVGGRSILRFHQWKLTR